MENNGRPTAPTQQKWRNYDMFTALLNNLKETRRTIVFTEGPDARIQDRKSTRLNSSHIH